MSFFVKSARVNEYCKTAKTCLYLKVTLLFQVARVCGLEDCEKPRNDYKRRGLSMAHYTE